MFIHSIIDKNTFSYWFPGFQVLPKNILNLNPVLPIFCPFLSPKSTKFPFRFYFYLISFMYYYYFIYTTLFLYEIMLMSYHNIKRSQNAQYQLKILYQQSILFHRKFIHVLLFYLCYLKSPICSHNNQESKQRCSNIYYNKFNAGPKHKIINYMSLILFIIQSHSSMAHHQRIIDYSIGLSMYLKYGI